MGLSLTMDSFNQSHHPQTTNFRYNPNPSSMNHVGDDEEEEEAEFSGILEIYVHQATNIHNICIYENQDVYAKFSLTYDPDETISTRIVNGGGKNPKFDENLRMKITQKGKDGVLKCEIWMFSRVRNYMEDQLLGFTLVPISQVLGKGKVTQEYSLSSTDLFHSPAGTVQLSLCLNLLNPSSSSVIKIISGSESVVSDSNGSEVVLLDPIEFSRIEFPDISVVRENQQMVSEYFNLASSSSSSALPFLRLSAASSNHHHHHHHHHHEVEDYEMTMNLSPNGSLQNSGFLSSSTTTSLSDDRNSSESIEKKKVIIINNSEANHHHHQNSVGNSSCGPDTPTSKKESEESRDEKVVVVVEAKFEEIKESKNNNNNNSNSNINEAAKFGQVFPTSLGNMNNINLEAEQCAMQKQIVDMYMRSMQQFTESLAKMKLPMDLNNKPDREEDCDGDLIQNHSSSSNSSKLEIDQKKTDRSRVFYGSRAFF